MTNTIICKNCERKFNPKRDWQIYCSPKCRLQYWRSHNAGIGQIQERLSDIEKRLERLERPGQ